MKHPNLLPHAVYTRHLANVRLKGGRPHKPAAITLPKITIQQREALDDGKRQR